ncbi:hypothetical protein DSM16313_13450 [Acinetobacter seohaensis]|nr:hypothetical protein DSM16313_13450 [Acinetobacter seohaensis]
MGTVRLSAKLEDATKPKNRLSPSFFGIFQHKIACILEHSTDFLKFVFTSIKNSKLI